MLPEEYQPRKIFTVEEANAHLPLVRAIVKDMVKLSADLFDRRERLNHLQGRRPDGSCDVYQEELSQIEQDLERDMERLQGYIDELVELGVEPKDARDGLVDFPAMLDGKLVYLCWKIDEREVLYWHSLESGFAGRQPLTANSIAGSGEAGASDGLFDA